MSICILQQKNIADNMANKVNINSPELITLCQYKYCSISMSIIYYHLKRKLYTYLPK